MSFKQVIGKIERNPRVLFLIDGFGAILSAFLLGVVLVQLEGVFGIPRTTLYVLAFIPCTFVFYDLYCYCRKSNDFKQFLKGIAYMNLLYCCISIVFALYHYQKIKYLGYIYLSVEIIILIALASLELKSATKLKIEESESQYITEN